MRTDWHVYNMKRRVAELHPVSFETFQDPANDGRNKKATPDRSHPSSSQAVHQPADGRTSSDDDSDESYVEVEQPEQCLFCHVESGTIENNIDHMASSHGFKIPDRDRLATDIETFLLYLSFLIGRFHSCLYCGQERRSSEAVRAHMLAKGHCMLDLSPNSEHWDFWKPDEDDALEYAQMVSETEIHLASGAVASSRQSHQPKARSTRKKTAADEEMAAVNQKPGDDEPRRDGETSVVQTTHPRGGDSAPEQSSATVPHTQALAVRDEMGIVGLSSAQRRSLAVVQKRMAARENRNRNEARWTLEKFENTQKQRKLKMSRSGVHSATQVS